MTPTADRGGRTACPLTAFFNARCSTPWAISEADLEVYASAYAAAGAMRAGFELYRTFDRDAEDNRAALRRRFAPFGVLCKGQAPLLVA